ncbi:hypothetical protein ADIARSV_2168 [Arcticibacter svalbardensis MN12-7]|uniref:Uncharacterized protein n=1 Tax=Arcticibacter svalbardensis MN12-7 TaxID=1150600 RepID=R9GSP4_9SPHI|nr:DUF6625 family protein [Arcticibacter svalbardensis]EOR94570.1 hypothetical protein ADIARSV_2168 [Arcticibacter svalbardensis MN12-7]
MKKIAVIALWFGKLPDYFYLWTRSLERNKDYTFLLFTDQHIPAKGLPSNLKVFSYSFDQIKVTIETSLSIKPALDYSYKLCDFRPAFGEVFASHLAGYQFWGYCDIDVLFGDLSRFITPEILATNHKIFNRGHFTLYKNEPWINQLYRSSKTINAKEIFESPACYIFDEWHGIHQIFKEFNLSQYHQECIADIQPNKARYTCSNIENFKKQLFIWENGAVKQYYIKNETLQSRELAYIHFKKRKIHIKDTKAFSSSSVMLNAFSFIPFEGTVTIDLVKKYDQANYIHFFQRQSGRLLDTLSRYIEQAVPIDKSLISKPIDS